MITTLFMNRYNRVPWEYIIPLSSSQKSPMHFQCTCISYTYQSMSLKQQHLIHTPFSWQTHELFCHYSNLLSQKKINTDKTLVTVNLLGTILALFILLKSLRHHLKLTNLCIPIDHITTSLIGNSSNATCACFKNLAVRLVFQSVCSV